MLRNFILPCLVVASAWAIKTWDYSFVTLDWDSLEDYFTSDVKIERISRGDYAVNGSYILYKDLGPKCKFSVKTFRSPRGNDDFKPLPFRMPKQDFDVFANGIYKDVLMEDLHKCSNLPYFEDKWDNVLKAQKYELNLCKASVSNWPDHMFPGFYKLLIEIFDEEDTCILAVNIVIEIESMGVGK